MAGIATRASQKRTDGFPLHSGRSVHAQLRWGGRPLTASMCHSGGVENTTEGGVHG